MKRPDTERSTPTSISAQCTGFRWKITPREQPIAIPANMAKSKAGISIARSPYGHHDGGDHQVDDRRWQENLPAKRHELVVAEPREGGPEPDEEEEERRELDQEPEDRRQDRPVPRAQEHGDRDAGDHHHVRVLAEEVERPLH